MKMNKGKTKLILVSTFLVFIVLGIFMRLTYAESSYTDREERFVPSNPDGFYWLNENIIDSELWADYNPIKNKYFSLITFLILIVLGLFIINVKEISLSMSLVFTILMLFSRYLYTLSSVGYYQHDYLGMCAFFIIILFYYLGGSYYILSPVVIYLLNYLWDGLIPAVYLFLVIIFIEYFLKDYSWKAKLIKYPLYVILTWIMIQNTFHPTLQLTQGIFYVTPIFIMLPLAFIGLWFSYKQWLWQGCIVFATITLLHSGKTIVIAYPIMFLALCMSLKNYKDKTIIITVLLSIFMVTQVGRYIQLDRFGTELTDEGMFYLRDNTPNDSKIMAWWDFGHYIEYQAGRDTLFSGSPENAGLTTLSNFFCDGTMPKLNFDYFVHFPYKKDIMPSILSYNGNNCNQSPYVNILKIIIEMDTRFELVYHNQDVEIYRRK